MRAAARLTLTSSRWSLIFAREFAIFGVSGPKRKPPSGQGGMDHVCGNDRIGSAAPVVDAAAPAGPGGPLGRGNYAHPRHGGQFSAGSSIPPASENRPAGRQDLLNLFFENSTRTRTSFGLAARRLGADTLDFSASSSSLSKGETFIDTAKNIEAMGVDVMVVRHQTPGTPPLAGPKPASAR